MAAADEPVVLFILVDNCSSTKQIPSEKMDYHFHHCSIKLMNQATQCYNSKGIIFLHQAVYFTKDCFDLIILHYEIYVC